MTPASTIQIWRYGSILLFCGVPLLLLALAVDNVIDASEARGEAERQQATLSQIVKQVARHGTRTLTPGDTAALYLASTSSSLARAEIQDRATKLVLQAGGAVVETQIVGLPEQEADGTIAVQVTMMIDNRGLRDLLYETETGLPLLDIGDLAVDRDDGPETGEALADRPLHVQMTLRGHWRKATG